jgi:hypothetical protein
MFSMKFRDRIALMMEAACTSETLGRIDLRTRQYIPETLNFILVAVRN